MDGKVVIGTELETKDLEKELKNAEKELQNYEKNAEKLTKQQLKIELDIETKGADIDRKIEEIKQKTKALKIDLDPTKDETKIAKIDTFSQARINSLQSEYNKCLDLANIKIGDIEEALGKNVSKQSELKFKIREVSEELENQSKTTMPNIGKGISEITSKVGKWALAVFSIRSAYMLVRQAVSVLASEDDQIKYDLEYLRWVLAQTLKPVVEWLIQAVYYILYAINDITTQLFNWNILTGKSANDFKTAKKNTGGMVSDLKEARKQLAGFDEMNVLNDNVKASGGGGDAGLDNWQPKVDPEDWKEKGRQAIENFVAGFLQHHDEVGEIREKMSIDDWFDVFGEWGFLVKGFVDTMWGLEEYVIGFFRVIEGEWKMLVGIFSGDNKLVEQGWQEVCDGMEQTWNGLMWTVIGLFEQIVGGIGGGLVWLLNQIFGTSEDAEQSATDASTSVKNSILGDADEIGKELGKKMSKFIYEDVPKFLAQLIVKGTEFYVKIKYFFEHTLPSFIRGVISGIVTKFGELGGKVGDAISGAFKSAINGVLGYAETILNKPISTINSLINKVNELPGVNISKLGYFRLPRLAKGGIINMPGRGVPVGSAIAGERGQEAVLPLTDSQQMELLGQSIGKYITINANITNTMNGRVISKELQKIQAENDFAFNK